MTHRALGCYIYAGGFTLGVRQHFDVLAHFEDGPFGVETVKHNMPDIDIFTDPETWPSEEYRGQADFVYGNPPCAPWSGAAVRPKRNRDFEHKDNYKHDPRVSCVYNLFDLLEAVRPRVWAWESVQGAWRRGRPLVDGLTEDAAKLGYAASYVLLNGAQLGLPQRRRRFFCVFHDVAIDWEYGALPKEEWKTVIEAWREAGLTRKKKHIERRHSETKKDIELMAIMPQGTGPRQVWEEKMREEIGPEDTWPRNERGHVIGRPGFNAQRLREDRISNTMLGGPHLIHPTEDRWISVKEAQVLCSYPVDYHFTPDNPDHCYTEMGRAVLPLVGEWLAKNVARALDQGDPVKAGKRFLVNLEKDDIKEMTA